MVIRLSALVILVALCTGLESNHKWDLAVAIGNQVELLDTKGSLVGVTLQEFRNVKALSFDDARHQFILSDMNKENDTIFRVPLGEKKAAIPIVSNIPDDVKNVAIDPITDILYWTDTLNKKILWISLNDVNAKAQVLFQFEEETPFGLAIDSCRRKLYWTNSNYRKSTIERSNLNGSERETIISGNLYLPVGITVDQGTSKLYWANQAEGIYFRIESASLDGSDRKLIYQDTYQSPHGIAVTDDMVYWTDTNNQALWGLKKGEDGHIPEILRKFPEKPLGLVAKHSDYEKIPQCSEVVNVIKEFNATAENYETATDSVECLNYGELTSHGCKCNRGYAGPRCEITLCHNYCITGECFISFEGYPQCKCPLGYIGSRCEREVCYGYCLNGGKCQPVLNNGSWSVSCECNGHFSGKRCEVANDAHALCSLLCADGDVHVNLEDGKVSCRCNTQQIDSYSLVQSQKSNASSQSLFSSSFESQFQERLKDPLVIASWLLTILMMFTIVGLLVVICRVRRRPRIKKRIIVNKNVTPLTYRPGKSTEQCEITIENCCNMNICETPCFEPPKLMGFQYSKPEEKKTLLTSMENGEDLY